MTPLQRFLDAQQRALRALEEASAFLCAQVEEINTDRASRGQAPIPELKPIGA